MPRISDALLRTRIPTALIIGAEPELLDRCQAAAVEVGVVVKGCPVSMAASLIQERRPLAIIVPDAIYSLDPQRYEIMARAVVGTVVRIDPEVSDHDLEEMLYRAVRASVKQREWRTGSGRYAVVNEPAPPSIREGSSDSSSRMKAVVPPSRRETPPPSSRGVAVESDRRGRSR
jgi:hypothetical protein